MRTQAKFVLMSGERSHLSPRENMWRTEELADCLRGAGFSFREVKGVYKGQAEVSFLVLVSNRTDVLLLDLLADQFQQECILESADGHGWLRHSGGEETYLGTLQEATGKEEAYTDLGDRKILFR